MMKYILKVWIITEVLGFGLSTLAIVLLKTSSFSFSISSLFNDFKFELGFSVLSLLAMFIIFPFIFKTTLSENIKKLILMIAGSIVVIPFPVYWVLFLDNVHYTNILKVMITVSYVGTFIAGMLFFKLDFTKTNQSTVQSAVI